jgi:DNA-directed RNA polymerase I, II, and III subunit RPABC2
MSDIEDEASVENSGSERSENEDDEEEELEEGEEDDLEELELEDLDVEDGPVPSKQPPVTKRKLYIESDEEDDDDNYLQKFDEEVNKNYINEFHPECLIHNYDEIAKLSVVMRDSNFMIVDPLHKTLPFMTKYEKARILGQRSKQIENGSRPFVKVPENIIDGYTIAELELQQKKIPFIIRRPIPGGAFEYWNMKDLECLI